MFLDVVATQYKEGCGAVYLIGEEAYVVVLEGAVEYEAELEATCKAGSAAPAAAVTGAAAATAAAALENVVSVGFGSWSAEMSKVAEAW